MRRRARRAASAASAARECESRYQALVNASSAVVWRADASGSVTDVANSSDLFGLRPEDFHGWHWLEAVHPEDREAMVRLWGNAIRERSPAAAEYRLRVPSGDYRWVAVRGVPILDDAGGVRGWIGTLTDVPDARRAQREARRIADRLAAALEVGAVGVWDIDLVHGRAFWSRSHFTMLGLDPDTTAAGYDTWARCIHPDDRPRCMAAWDRAAETREEYHCEHRVVWPDGGVRWVEARGRFSYDERGNPVRMLGAFVDVTDSRAVSERVRGSEARLRSLVVATSQIIWTATPDGLGVEDSPSWRAFTGQTPDQSQNLGWLNAIHPDDRGRVAELYRSIVANPRTLEVEYRLQRADGTYAWTVARAVPLVDEDGRLREWVGTNTDITAQREAEEDLREREGRLRLAQEVSGIGTFDWNVQTGVVRWTVELERMYGLAPGSFPGTETAWEDLVHPEDRAETARRVREATEKGDFAHEWRIVRPDGTVRWVAGRAFLFKDDSGQPRRLLGVNIDITERRQAEEAARDSEHWLRLALGAGRMGTFVWDGRTDELKWSPEHFPLLGLTPNVVKPTYRGWADAIHPEDRPRVEAELRRAMRECRDWSAEYRVVWPDGSVHWAEGRGTIAVGENARGPRMAGVMIDIDARKRVEAEREELLGIAERARGEAESANHAKDEFLAMLAHELRNPLSAVRNAVAIASLDESRRERALGIARRQADQLGRLIDDLLDVARITQGRITLRKERVHLVGIVDRAVESTRSFVESRGHQLEVAFPPGEVSVEADPGRLEQVFVNLLTNAAKYTPPGGRIELVAEREPDQVVVRVRDTGIGIAPEMLPRVWELFTQADRGLDRAQGGLGIGLTVARRLLELHGGQVEARSEGLGKGAEFIVRLPALPPRDGDAGERAAAAPPERLGRARVLMVEDNPDAADSLMMLLELLGHRVRMVHDGVAALEAARASAPDVMLVDIGLPGMDGYEVARRIRRDPHLQHLVLVALTGYGRDEDRERSMSAGFDHHLVKPVDPTALKDLIARLGKEPAGEDSSALH